VLTVTVSLMTASPEERSPEQIAHETAMSEVAETLMNIEQAQRRADRARRQVALLGRDPNVEQALTAALAALEQTHRTLFQDAYFGGDQQRLV